MRLKEREGDVLAAQDAVLEPAVRALCVGVAEQALHELRHRGQRAAGGAIGLRLGQQLPLGVGLAFGRGVQLQCGAVGAHGDLATLAREHEIGALRLRDDAADAVVEVHERRYYARIGLDAPRLPVDKAQVGQPPLYRRHRACPGAEQQQIPAVGVRPEQRAGTERYPDLAQGAPAARVGQRAGVAVDGKPAPHGAVADEHVVAREQPPQSFELGHAVAQRLLDMQCAHAARYRGLDERGAAHRARGDRQQLRLHLAQQRVAVGVGPAAAPGCGGAACRLAVDIADGVEPEAGVRADRLGVGQREPARRRVRAHARAGEGAHATAADDGAGDQCVHCRA